MYTTRLYSPEGPVNNSFRPTTGGCGKTINYYTIILRTEYIRYGVSPLVNKT